MTEKKERNKLYKESAMLFMCVRNAKDYGIEKQLLLEMIDSIYDSGKDGQQQENLLKGKTQ